MTSSSGAVRDAHRWPLVVRRGVRAVRPPRPCDVLVVALGLELVGELGAALLGDPAVDEDVDVVGRDVAQDPGVVRDQQDALALLGAEPVDALGDDLERVDVEAGVGLVEDRDLGVEQLELGDLVALLLAAGEALVDVALRERRVQVELLEGGVDVLDPGAQLGRLAVDGGLGGAQEVGHRDAGHLDGVLHGQEQPGAGALVDGHREHVLAVEGHRAAGDRVLRVAGDGVGQRRLARPVGAHDRVGLAVVDGQRDALEDLLGAVLGVDARRAGP